MKIDKKQITNQELFSFIEQITPLNNQYRDLVKKEDGVGKEVLMLMWEVGDMIDKHIKKHSIKPHALYWQVYGKAEGLKNSYITRDFLSYCLRIRKYFSDKETVREKFPNLRRYSLFREAFPLLENPKYKLTGEEIDKIISILNSNNNPGDIKNFILSLKSKQIGIKNARTQRLSEMKPIAENFALIYSFTLGLIKKNDHNRISKIRNEISKDLLEAMSQTVASLTQENLYVPEIKVNQKLPAQWEKFIDNLKYLTQSTVEVRNRFRRLIQPRDLFDLANMLNALETDRSLTNYRKQKGIGSST